jgi:acetyl-CoA C-acetyltransferase
MNRVAVIGGGMTLFRRRLLETGKELSFLATKMAMEDSGIEKKDIDMVVMGSAPDAFDGIHMKGENLLDGAAAANKPYVRVFNGGGTSVFAPIAGWWHVASGVADTALVVCEEKMGSCFPHPQTAFQHIWDPVIDRPLHPNLVWLFAMEMNRYMTVHDIKKEDIALVAVKNKRNAAGHPCAQLPDEKTKT